MIHKSKVSYNNYKYGTCTFTVPNADSGSNVISRISWTIPNSLLRTPLVKILESLYFGSGLESPPRPNVLLWNVAFQSSHSELTEREVSSEGSESKSDEFRVDKKI